MSEPFASLLFSDFCRVIADTKAQSDIGRKRSRLGLPNTNPEGHHFFFLFAANSLVCRKLSSLYYNIRINEVKRMITHAGKNRASCHSWSVTMDKKGSIIRKLQTQEKASFC